MNIFRKSIAVLILIFIAIPTLIGIIWGVGVTRAVVSREFLADLPAEIIEKVPDMIDEVLLEMDREDMVDDPEARAWVKAIANAETSPKELLEKIGVTAWLENELAKSFTEMGQMVRGEIPIKPIILDLRPLKKALQHEAITDYLIDILERLPACDGDQINVWIDATENPREIEDLPACRPTDIKSAAAAIRYMQTLEIDEIPDEVNMVEDGDISFPEGIDIAKDITKITYLLFLVPGIFFLLAALIGGDGKTGFFKWMGVSTVIGGGITWAMAAMLSQSIPWSMTFGPHRVDLTSLETLMMGKVKTIGVMFTDRLLGGVESVAGVVCVIGIVFFALSFLLPEPEEKNDNDDNNKKSTAAAAPEQSPDQPQTPPAPADDQKIIDAPVIKDDIKDEKKDEEKPSE